jgi:hypothetical protein
MISEKHQFEIYMHFLLPSGEGLSVRFDLSAALPESINDVRELVSVLDRVGTEWCDRIRASRRTDPGS